MRNKDFLFFLFLFFLSKFISAQTYFPFPDSNARWSVLYQSDHSGVGAIDANTIFYFINGDTIIGNKIYHKIFGTKDSIEIIQGHSNNSHTVTTSYIGGIRQDSFKRIFFLSTDNGLGPICFSDTTEQLLYQFGLNIGDTIVIKNNWDSLNIISKIDSILINGMFRNQYSFEKWPYYKWIEGIGSDWGLFSPYCLYFEESSTLLCFYHNDSLIYQSPNNPYCSLSSGIEEDFMKDKSVKFFPNPLSNISTLKINNSNNEKFTLRIFNLFGLKVKEIQNITSNEIQINKKDFSEGFYLFRLNNNNGKNNFSGKFIVE